MKILIVVALASLLSGTAMAQDNPANHNRHQAHMAQLSGDLPKELGQSAFAAIQEIVAKLEADPKTDWSKVNIEALRQHLIDMDNVTLRAKVTAENIEGGARFTVTSTDQDVLSSVRRMLRAHTATMGNSDLLKMSLTELPNGMALTAIGDAQKLRALGLIGIMSIGMHHQSHHWAIASGQNQH